MLSMAPGVSWMVEKRAWVTQFCEQHMRCVIGTSISKLTLLAVWVSLAFAVVSSPTASVRFASSILVTLHLLSALSVTVSTLCVPSVNLMEFFGVLVGKLEQPEVTLKRWLRFQLFEMRMGRLFALILLFAFLFLKLPRTTLLMHTLRPTFEHRACDSRIPTTFAVPCHDEYMCRPMHSFDRDPCFSTAVSLGDPSFDAHAHEVHLVDALPFSPCGLNSPASGPYDFLWVEVSWLALAMDFGKVTEPLPLQYLEYLHSNEIETIVDWVQWYSNRLVNVHETLEALDLSPQEDLCVLTCFTAAQEAYKTLVVEKAHHAMIAATATPKSLPVKARPPLRPLQPSAKASSSHLRPGEVHHTTRDEVATETVPGSDPVEARKAKNKEDALDRMWSLAMSVPGVADYLGVDVCRPRSEYAALLKGPSDLTTERLRCLNNGLQRFVTWCAAQRPPVEPFEARPAALAEFFQHVSRGGPTAAVSAYFILDFWARKFNFKFSLSDPLIKSWSVALKGHRVTPAAELQPWEFHNMCVLVGQELGSLRKLYDLQMMVTCSCIRFKHVQRSSLCSPDGVFTCAEGKVKANGVARAPYDWVMGVPPDAAGGPLLLKNLIQFWDEDMPSQGFLMPSFRADRTLGLTSDLPLLTNRAMSSSRFMEVLRGLLLRAGCSMQRVRGVKYNTLRRFLPTAANCFGFSPEDQQAIGSWQDIPSGGMQSSSSKPTADNRTSLRYAGGKLDRSLTAKTQALRLVWSTTRAVMVKDSIQLEHGLLPPDSVTWQSIAEYRRQKPELASRPPKVLRLADAEEDDDGSEQESVSSAVQSEDLDLTYVAGEVVIRDMEFFRQNSAATCKYHIVSTREPWTEGGRPVPWCRNLPFHAEPAGGVYEDLREVANPQLLCARCLNRMPHLEKEVVRQFLFPEESV